MDKQLGLFGDSTPVKRPGIVVPVVTAKIQVFATGKFGKRKAHGVIDVALRIAQLGGEPGNFIYRKLNIVTMAHEVWEQIRAQCDRIEIIDHTMNRCYSIPTWICRKHTGTVYNAGIGDRIGWDAEWWTITDANGEVVQPGVTPGE
jgi:hypothetical protein